MDFEYGLQGFGEPEGEDFGSFEGEEFNDFEYESFLDGEGFDAPTGFTAGQSSRIDAETANMLMDMYADMAARSDSEEEADQFLPLLAALAPLAAKALPLAMGAAKTLLPVVAKGVMTAGKKMLATAGPQAMRALPNIARGVARDAVQQVANGGDVSGDLVMRSAARHTLPYLQDPRRRQAAARQTQRRARQARRCICRPVAQLPNYY